MNLLAGLTGLYSILIFIRVMLTWFSGARFGRAAEILGSITDPYLGWWRRFPLRAGFLDLSPIAAMAALSLAQNLFSTIARYGSVTLGIILAITLSSLWSAAGFILGFFILILILRLAAYLTSRNIYSPFWKIIETISRPILYRISRIIFGKRLVNFLTSLILSILILLFIRIAGNFAVRWAFVFLIRLPV
jgi:YggT family protein